MTKQPFTLLFIAALLCTLNVNAVKKLPLHPCGYRVTETGPRPTPYTIIRLYNNSDVEFLEIVMHHFRWKINNGKKIKKLNRLLVAGPVEDFEKIATLLGIKACRITTVKKNC